jgi:tetratricopeptide (TPR) repeat protein
MARPLARAAALIAAALIVAALLARPAIALWCDDMGNLAYVRGDGGPAQAWFTRGLAIEPGWSLLREDLGRSMLASDPRQALAYLESAACGRPCTAEEGDAQIRLGDPKDAVDDFLAARAVDRVAQSADELAARRRYADAIALESALANRLGHGMLAQADLASAYFSLGKLDTEAAGSVAPAARAGYERSAIASFHRASALAPFNEGYLLSLGYAELKWGSRADAKAAFDRLLELHPQESEAQQGLRMLGAPTPTP